MRACVLGCGACRLHAAARARTRAPKAAPAAEGHFSPVREQAEDGARKKAGDWSCSPGRSPRNPKKLRQDPQRQSTVKHPNRDPPNTAMHPIRDPQKNKEAQAGLRPVQSEASQAREKLPVATSQKRGGHPERGEEGGLGGTMMPRAGHPTGCLPTTTAQAKRERKGRAAREKKRSTTYLD